LVRRSCLASNPPPPLATRRPQLVAPQTGCLVWLNLCLFGHDFALEELCCLGAWGLGGLGAIKSALAYDPIACGPIVCLSNASFGRCIFGGVVPLGILGMSYCHNTAFTSCCHNTACTSCCHNTACTSCTEWHNCSQGVADPELCRTLLNGLQALGSLSGTTTAKVWPRVSSSAGRQKSFHFQCGDLMSTGTVLFALSTPPHSVVHRMLHSNDGSGIESGHTV
jgi:hypothetical protein